MLKGFTQTFGIDYLETFAPIAKMITIRFLLSYAVNLGWDLQQLDVKSAFFCMEIWKKKFTWRYPWFFLQKDREKFVN